MTEGSWKLRPVGPGDLETLFELHRIVFRPHIEEIWGWDEATQRALFRRDLEASSTEVVEADGDTVGYLQTDLDANRLFLRNLVLHPARQGCGIGSGLVERLQRDAAGHGVPIELVVFRTNPRAERFYERLGFERTGRSAAFVEMRWSDS